MTPTHASAQARHTLLIKVFAVLFYFMYSPFFEPGCRNAEVFDDRRDMDRWIRIISTYQSFQAELKRKPGVEYVLWNDPEDANVMVDGPNGTPERSSLYIIRKQRRHDEHSVAPMAYYWCMGIRIFQAPCAANVLTPRILDLSTALHKSFEKMAQLSVFSAPYGHTWEKPGQKTGKKDDAAAAAAAAVDVGRMSKDNSPAPTQETASEKAGSTAQAVSGPATTTATTATTTQDEGDSRTLAQALRLTNLYRSEYADEVTLVGEPGNFRFTKDRMLSGTTTTTSLGPPSQQRDLSRAATPLGPGTVPVRQASIDRSR